MKTHGCEILSMLLMLAALCDAAEPVVVRGCANTRWLTRDVLVGGQPERAGFDALRRHGIETIISVDGPPPDIRAAAKAGLRYVHVPVGYDGLKRREVCTVAAAIRRLPGLVYIHCHYGRHRAPAVAAAACVALDELSCRAGLEFLQQAGTDLRYTALHAGVREARPVTREELEAIRDFPESVDSPALVKSMGSLDTTFRRLEETLKADRGTQEAAIEESLQLYQLFSEMRRTEESVARPPQFLKLLKESEESAAGLARQLSGEPVNHGAVLRQLAKVREGCVRCHFQQRDR